MSLVVFPLMAQTQQFFTATTYRGAFEPSPSPMWTSGWANWDPQNSIYPTPNICYTDSIGTNKTWTNTNTYLIQGPLYVEADLTIQPGTIVLFDKTTPGSALIITKKGRLFADGQIPGTTLIQPIVFASNAPVGQRAMGDWGGIIILGNAKNNLNGGLGNIEGLPVSANTQYGGNNDADTSGVLRYVRIEFGGYAYQPDKEINGLTMGSVGQGTTIDFIQVSYTNDDAFEWFGGSVECKHLVSYRNLDDDFDTDFGYHGKVQFGLIVRDPNIADQSPNSTSEGFESDNDGSGTNNTPKTSAVFSNITAIGPLRGNIQSTIDPKFKRALRLRRNTELKVFNSVFMDFKEGLHVEGVSAEVNASLGSLVFKNNVIAGCKIKYLVRSANPSFNIKTWFLSGNNDTLVNTTGLLSSPYNYLNPDYRPSLNGILISGADFTDSNLIGSGISINELDLSPQPYPNPIVDMFYSNVEGDLVDAFGRVVGKINKGWNSLISLQNGVYFLKGMRIIKI